MAAREAAERITDGKISRMHSLLKAHEDQFQVTGEFACRMSRLKKTWTSA
jgi:DNA-binding FadR family transcriptional regulator